MLWVLVPFESVHSVQFDLSGIMAWNRFTPVSAAVDLKLASQQAQSVGLTQL